MMNYKMILRHILSSTILMIIFSVSNYSQTYIDVTPGFGTLNDAITNNTNPNVIFRLQRGDNAIYLLNGSISNTLPLYIEAAQGTGSKPKLIPGLGSSGSSDIAFRLKANIFLKNVYVSGMDAAGALKSQILRDMADSIKIYADSCFFENSAQSFIRTDNQLAKIRLTNSIVRNCLGDFANGRAIDDRGNNMDTLYLENNTFYNISSRVLRDGGGWINYVYVNHNTFVNLGKYILAIGECPTVIFTNNLSINCGFTGQNQSSTGALVTLSSLISTNYNGRVQSVEAHNNNFASSTTFPSHFPDTVTVVPNFNSQMLTTMASSGFDTANFSELVKFTLEPPAVDSIITGYWANGGNDAYPANGLQATSDYNFSYPTNSKSYTGGTNGQPVGSLNWFNIISDVKNKHVSALPSSYTLEQNYPNPFNPETIIEYTLPKQSAVKLIIYNSLGEEIKTLIDNIQSAGIHFIKWNGTNKYGQKVSSGIYFYRITSGKFSDIKKMIMIK